MNSNEKQHKNFNLDSETEDNTNKAQDLHIFCWSFFKSTFNSLLGMLEGQLANFENETWYQEMVRNMRLMDYVNTLAAEWTTRLQGWKI